MWVVLHGLDTRLAGHGASTPNSQAEGGPGGLHGKPDNVIWRAAGTGQPHFSVHDCERIDAFHIHQQQRILLLAQEKTPSFT